jgi:hypothetical protein
MTSWTWRSSGSVQRIAEPRIERIKTEVYFADAAGVEWQVIDGRRVGGRLRRQYPGSDDAQLRYFVRFTPVNGANARRAIEVRRYRFDPDDSRWFTPELWQLQLDMAVPARSAPP